MGKCPAKPVERQLFPIHGEVPGEAGGEATLPHSWGSTRRSRGRGNSSPFMGKYPAKPGMGPTELRFTPSVVTDTTTARSSRRAWRQSACRQTDADVDECNRAVDLVAASRPKGGWVEVPAPAADRAIFRGLLLPRGKTHR